MVTDLQAKGPVIAVDAGNWSWRNADIALPQREQQRVKGELVAGSFSATGLDAALAGIGDLALGLDWLSGLSSRSQLPLLNANLRCGESEPFPGSKKVERDGVTVGIIGVIGVGKRVPEGCSLGAPIEAIQEELALLGPVDVVLLLAQVDTKEAIGLSTAVPALDLIVTADPGAQFDAPRSAPNDALILASGSRGKQLGTAVVTLIPGAHGFASEESITRLTDELDRARKRLEAARAELPKVEGDKAKERKERQLRYYEEQVPKLEAELAAATQSRSALAHRLDNKLVPLGADIPDLPATAARLVEGKARINAATPTTVTAVSSGNGAYVGSAACTGCHKAEAAQWQSTGHSHAWNTLERVGRQGDQACFSCHATGAGLEGGPQSPGEVGLLQHVGCESCHGAGRGHIADPQKVGLLASPGAEVCVRCHDGKQDEGRFDYARYLPRVRHGGGP